MNSFKRLFKYIWPQWQRITAVVICAVMIGMLFAVSIGTILPLLKVMMNKEGLHGWVDRTVSKKRYGLSFYLHDVTDFNSPETISNLRITAVEADSVAAEANLREGDLIVAVNDTLNETPEFQKLNSLELLEKLATATAQKQITIRYKSLRDQQLISGQTTLIAPAKPFYIKPVRWVTGFVPRQRNPQNSERAVMLIILMLVIATALRCTAKFYQNYTVNKVVQTAVTNLRQDMFVHAMELPAGFFADDGATNTVSKITRDTSTAGSGMKVLFGKALREPLKAMFLIIVAMAIDFKLTIVFLCAVPGAVYMLANLGRKMKHATRKSLVGWSKILAKLNEAVNAVKVVKVYNRQQYESSTFGALNKKLLKQLFKMAKVDALTGPMLETLGMVAGSAGLLIAIQWVYQN